MLWIKPLRVLGAGLFAMKNWHVADYNLFWENIRTNLVRQVELHRFADRRSRNCLEIRILGALPPHHRFGLPSCVTPLALLFVLLLPALHAQDTTQVNWAGTLAGNESAAIELTAGCSLDAFFISLDIVAPGSNWAGDMAIAITAPTETASNMADTIPGSAMSMPAAGPPPGTPRPTATSQQRSRDWTNTN